MTVEELDDIALREYKSVKYFPFQNIAGAPLSLTSDPFGFLVAWLDGELTAIKRDSKARNRLKLEKAKYFTLLSRDFYKSSISAQMPSKATILYYSYINLVKVFLIIKGHDLETKTEHHGLSLPPSYSEKLKLINLGAGNGISIFHEFAKNLGKPINNADGLDLKLSDIIWQLPEVHEIGYALNIFNNKRKFLPVEIKIRTNKARKKIYYTLEYKKKFDKQMKVEKLRKGICKTLLTDLNIKNDKKKYFKSKLVISYTKSSENSWNRCYPRLIEDINKLNIVTMLTRDGYKFYLDLEPYRMHRLSSFLAFSYYIGTVARYRPTLNEKILKGKFQPIINEAIISCPEQFFYLLVSKITEKVCAIPKAKLS